MRFLCTAGLFLALLGCENAEAKLGRLDTEKTAACLQEQVVYQRYKEGQARTGDSEQLSAVVEVRNQGDSVRANSLDSARRAGHTASGLDTLAGNWMQARTKCELATRAYDGFMR